LSGHKEALMTISETAIRTEFASRYLTQLCKHWSHKFEVTFTPEHGVIPFNSGSVCTLDASQDALHLKLQTGDADKQMRMQGVVIDHLKRFAHREDLGAPVWTPNS
jgi:uncharacterized protein